MIHLSPDECIDAVEGMLAEDKRGHLAECPACSREVRQLSAVLRDARDVDVPEPSPLFWSHFSERVGAAVQVEAASGRWTRWLTWPVLGPIGAMALVVLALITAMPPRAGLDRPQALFGVTAAPDEASDDPGWTLVADMVGELDWDAANAAGLVVQPGSAERAALGMTAQERQALVGLLEAELRRVKS